jgi:hypothetical protein
MISSNFSNITNDPGSTVLFVTFVIGCIIIEEGSCKVNVG